MRGTFFLYLAFGLLALILAYCVFLVLKAIWTIISDARTHRELDRLAVEYTERRRKRKEEDRERLNNGCDHQYGDPLSALPKDVCNKCGLAKERPPGRCDHVWRVLPDVIPSSQCERCGERYSTVAKDQT